MSRERELKILDVDPDAISAKLLELGAKLVWEGRQQIYTYDFPPVGLTIPPLLDLVSAGPQARQQEVTFRNCARRLWAALADFDDLISAEERTSLLAGTGCRSLAELVDAPRDPTWLAAVGRVWAATSAFGVNPNKWIRLRNGPEGTTLTVKQILGRRRTALAREHDFGATREVEVGVADFETARHLLEELGFFPKNYQEKHRSRFKLGERHVVDLDQWPHIPPYLEIEAEAREEIEWLATALGFSPGDLKSLNTDDVYSLYGLDMYSFAELRF